MEVSQSEGVHDPCHNLLRLLNVFKTTARDLPFRLGEQQKFTGSMLWTVGRASDTFDTHLCLIVGYQNSQPIILCGGLEGVWKMVSSKETRALPLESVTPEHGKFSSLQFRLWK